MTSHFMGSTISVDAEGKKAAYAIAGGKLDDDGNMKLDKDGKIPAAPEYTLRPEKKKLLGHVSDALGAMVRALKHADGEKGGAFYITDYFGLMEGRSDSAPESRRAKGQEGDYAGRGENHLMGGGTTADRVKKARQDPRPRAANHDAQAGVQDARRAVPGGALPRGSRTSRRGDAQDVEVSSIHLARSSSSQSRAIQDPDILQPARGAATRAQKGKSGKVPETGLAESPRPCLVGVASGGYGVLEQMAELSTDKHSVRLIVLHGSGRLADMWAEIWPRRGEETFDPTVASLRRRSAACFPPLFHHVECMRRVLATAR